MTFMKNADHAGSRSTLSRLWWVFQIYLVFLSACVEVALQSFYYVTAGDVLFRRVGLPVSRMSHSRASEIARVFPSTIGPMSFTLTIY